MTIRCKKGSIRTTTIHIRTDKFNSINVIVITHRYREIELSQFGKGGRGGIPLVTVIFLNLGFGSTPDYSFTFGIRFYFERG